MIPRNVLNVGEVEAFLDDIAIDFDAPGLNRWVRRAARRWILNHHASSRRVVRDAETGAYALIDGTAEDAAPAPYRGPTPDWLPRALAKGQDVIVLDLDAVLRKRVRRVLQYFAATCDQPDAPKLDRLTFENAESAAIAWRRTHAAEIRKRRRPAAGSATKVVKLTTARELHDEGQRMKHCVGSYARRVEDRRSQIYSLRNEGGQSRATIEVKADGRIAQTRGYGNGPVPHAYRPALRRFVDDGGFSISPHSMSNFSMACAALEPRDGKPFATPERLQWLHRMRYVTADRWSAVDCDQASRTLLRAVRKLDSSELDLVLAALMPDADAPVRLYRARRLLVYDSYVSHCLVATPILLINLVRRNAVSRADLADDARSARRAVEAAVAGLVMGPADRIFVLGQPCHHPRWRRRIWHTCADIAREGGNVDSALRSERHLRLRRRLNEAKRRTVGRHAKASAGHVKVRRMLDGVDGSYVI
jgi:hypothetical protein